MTTCYTVPEIWCLTDVIIFHFGLFLALLPLTAQKIKILKKWKKSLDISSFYICVPKIMIRWCTFPEIWCAMDGWTDGQMDRKSDIQRWVPHLKNENIFIDCLKWNLNQLSGMQWVNSEGSFCFKSQKFPWKTSLIYISLCSL